MKTITYCDYVLQLQEIISTHGLHKIFCDNGNDDGNSHPMDHNNSAEKTKMVLTPTDFQKTHLLEKHTRKSLKNPSKNPKGGQKLNWHHTI